MLTNFSLDELERRYYADGEVEKANICRIQLELNDETIEQLEHEIRIKRDQIIEMGIKLEMCDCE